MQSLPLSALAGLTALCAAALSLALAALGLAVGLRITIHFMALSFAILFFLALTQLPLPDSALMTMQCPILGPEPNWIPFETARQIVLEWRGFFTHPNSVPLEILPKGSGAVQDWLRHRTFKALVLGDWALPTLMNLLVCVPIGVLLVPYLRSVRSASLAGLALSLTAELTQITATWGLYPCPYRKFDVDDLILNTLGVALGFLAARRKTRARPPLSGGRGG